MDGDPDPKARGPQEKPHAGADQLRRWGWRRTRPEPIRPVEFSLAGYIEVACQRATSAHAGTQRQQRTACLNNSTILQEDCTHLFEVQHLANS
jgi:hypothetical protein